jgi:hypothetical protein
VETPEKKKKRQKTGGRQKGTRNRNSLNVLGALDKANLPLIEIMMTDIAMLDPKDRIAEYKWLMKFCYPELKSIEYVPPPSGGAPAAGETPAPEMTPEERLRLIRGHVTGKPAAPGK